MRSFQTFVFVNLLWLLVFNRGGISSIDASTRLWMTHLWWNDASAVYSEPHLTIDIDGKTIIPYDVGQPALMLPADWLGTQLAEKLSNDSYIQRNIREAVVSYFFFLPISLACVISGYWMLRLLDFEARTAALSSTIWLLATTVLQYSVVNQQNNQVLLFLLLGMSGLLAARKYKRASYAILSGLSFGAASLVRISSLAYASIGFLLCLVSSLPTLRQSTRNDSNKIDEGELRSGKGVKKVLWSWLLGFLPFLVLDRWLSAMRFGDWTITSIAVHWQALQPSLQPVQEITTEILTREVETISFLKMLLMPSHFSGIWGPLFSLEKSIFIYDALLLPGILLLIFKWGELSTLFRVTILTIVGMFLVNLGMYSNFESWGGDASWGARYHVTAIHLLLLPLIALMVRTAFFQDRDSPRVNLTRRIYICLFTIAIALQIAAISLPYTLEIAQEEAKTGSSFRLGQRLENIVILLLPDNTDGLPASVHNKSDFHLDRNLWSWMPYGYDQKLPQDSPLRRFLPIIFSVWFSLLFLAIDISRRFLKQLKA